MDGTDLQLRRRTYAFFVEHGRAPVAAELGEEPFIRSEERTARWLGAREPGATIPAAKLSELAHAWWNDRLSPDWVPHMREQNQAILERLGLSGAFWQLA